MGWGGVGEERSGEEWGGGCEEMKELTCPSRYRRYLINTLRLMPSSLLCCLWCIYEVVEVCCVRERGSGESASQIDTLAKRARKLQRP